MHTLSPQKGVFQLNIPVFFLELIYINNKYIGPLYSCVKESNKRYLFLSFEKETKIKQFVPNDGEFLKENNKRTVCKKI